MVEAALLIFIAAIVWLIWTYNSLVRGRNRVRNAWSQIDVQLKRRHDLIPNLVEVVKGYLAHERGTLEAVSNARGEALRAKDDPVARSTAEAKLGHSLRSLYAVMENYPDLKAISAVRDLMEQLTTTESRIAFARQHYNDSSLALNNKIGTFPSSLVAGTFNFTPAEYFEVESGQL